MLSTMPRQGGLLVTSSSFCKDRAHHDQSTAQSHCSKSDLFTRFLVYYLSLIIFNEIQQPAKANNDAKRLYEDLMTSYNRFVRPVGNNSDVLVLKMGIKLSQLIDVVSIHV